jgi:hypothetical protein
MFPSPHISQPYNNVGFTILSNRSSDTVIMAESAVDFQKQLDSFSDYCNIWRLKVNVEKSKIVVFSQGRTPNNLKFNYGKQLQIIWV